MVLPLEIDDTVTGIKASAADLVALQTAIDALAPSPPTDDLVPIVQSLKDITATLNVNLQTFISVIQKVRVGQ